MLRRNPSLAAARLLLLCMPGLGVSSIYSLAAQTNPEPPPPSGSTLSLQVNVANAPLYTTLTQTVSGSTTAYSYATPANISGTYPQKTTANGTTATTLLLRGWVANNDGFAGLSYEKSILQSRLLTSSNTALINLFKLLYPGTGGVLRIGGNAVDQSIWSATGSGQTAGYIAPSDVQALAGFLQATGWKVIYGIDLANANTSPSLAAAEAQYASQQLGSSLLAFEIGNEPENYVPTYFPIGWGISNYMTLYQSFASAIENAVPSAPLAGPASSGNSNAYLSWFTTFATARVPGVMNLTHHYYRGSAAASPAPTAADLISYPDTQLLNDIEQLEYFGYTKGTYWRMGETNSYYGGGASGVSNAYASTLWSIDELFTLAQFNGRGGNFHGGGGGSYTPIANSGNSVLGPRPLFYGLYFSTLAGTGTMEQVSITGNTSNANVSAYAVQLSSNSGHLNVIINNKSAQTLTITLTPAQTINSGTLAILSNANLPNEATLTSSDVTTVLTETSGVTVQGSTIGNDGSFSPNAPYTLTVSGNQTTFTVPPLSAALASLQN